MVDVAPTAKVDSAAPESKQQSVKPEKPDEAAYKDGLYKLEKVHTEAQAKYVCHHYLSS